MSTPASALIIGGGFIGTIIAWQLQRAGLRTTLLDPGDAKLAASWGNAGHLATEQLAPLASRAVLRSLPRRLFGRGGPVSLPAAELGSWLPFGLRLVAASHPRRFEQGRQALAALQSDAMAAWQRLASATTIPEQVRALGHYVAWESPDSAAAGMRSWQSEDLGSVRVHSASPDELRMLQQHFRSRPVAALRFENTGQLLDVVRAREQLQQAFIHAGGNLCQGRARALQIREGRAQVLAEVTSQGQIDASPLIHSDHVIVAAGARSGELLHGLDGPVPLIAERGYHIECAVDAQAWPSELLPVAFEDRSIIVTRFQDRWRMTGFTEFARVDTPPDARKWQRLQAHAEQLGLPGYERCNTWQGARPTLPDYLPAIGRSRAAANLVYAFGHQHLGVTLAAVTGERVRSLVLEQQQPDISLQAFDLARFA
jgi:glycine/D-amino acid oxidase-like deaminating enzyme